MQARKIMTADNGFYVMVILVAALLVFTAAVTQNNRQAIGIEPAGRLDGLWQYRLPDESTGQAELPMRLAVPLGETYTISHPLPAESFSGETLRIRTSQQTLRVLVDGQEIYAYGGEQQLPFLRGPGSLYHFVRIEAKDAGKLLTLELSSVYRQYSGYANEVAIGTKNALVMEVVEANMLSLVICVFISVIGLILIGSYIFFRKSWAVNRGALYLGIEAVCIGLWSATECRLIEFIVPNPTVVYMLTFTSLLLIPLPALAFLRTSYPANISQRTFAVAGWILLVMMSLILLLQLSGTADFMETLPISHAAIGLVCLLLIGAVISDLRQRRRLSALAVGLLFLAGCVSADLLRFYRGGFYGDSAAVMRVGMLLFMVVLGVDAINKMYQMMRRGMEYQTLEKVAYIDGLTKCSNRAAFERVMEQLAAASDAHPAVELMMIDVNNFKHFNDDYGHQAGDKVLQAVSSSLQAAFAECAACYRVGGDEFVLLAPAGFDHWEARLHHAQGLIKNEASPYDVSLACGKAGYADCGAEDIWAVYQKADQRMYEHKHQQAEQKQGDDR